jgi:hypothetical protein
MVTMQTNMTKTSKMCLQRYTYILRNLVQQFWILKYFPVYRVCSGVQVRVGLGARGVVTDSPRFSSLLNHLRMFIQLAQLSPSITFQTMQMRTSLKYLAKNYVENQNDSNENCGRVKRQNLMWKLIRRIKRMRKKVGIKILYLYCWLYRLFYEQGSG